MKMNDIDNVSPIEKWKFDKEVSHVFPNMLSRSIPSYMGMRESISRVAIKFLNNNKNILDIGCSRGDTLKDIFERHEKPKELLAVGVDSSKHMIDHAVRQFKDWDNVSFVEADVLEIGITPGKYGLALCVLTAQFIPIEKRQKLFKNIYDGLDSSCGAFILVEKVLGENSFMQDLLVDIYYELKTENGYSAEQIESKRKSLEGVLVPLTASENERFLERAGFTAVQRFWQDLNFVAWLAVK